MPTGVVTKGIGGFYYIDSLEGYYECKPRGIFRKNGMTPLPGDRVLYSILDNEAKVGSIDEILPRSSQLVRPAVVNVDQVVVVISIKSPSPDFMLLDKLIVTAESKGLDVVICINKMDFDSDCEYLNIINEYEKTNYKIITSSIKFGVGITELLEVLKGKISVLSGQSGVGKSTIINKIMNESIMETGKISDRSDRGKHTTRHAELIKINEDSFILDTPGFSSFELSEIELDNLQFCYPEFKEYINKCKFSHCSHIKEPDCAVKNALKDENMNLGRYNRYVQLYEFLKQIKKY